MRGNYVSWQHHLPLPPYISVLHQYPCVMEWKSLQWLKTALCGKKQDNSTLLERIEILQSWQSWQSWQSLTQFKTVESYNYNLSALFLFTCTWHLYLVDCGHFLYRLWANDTAYICALSALKNPGSDPKYSTRAQNYIPLFCIWLDPPTSYFPRSVIKGKSNKSKKIIYLTLN